jgi:hypothetical protein
MFNADTYENELEGTFNQEQYNKQVVVGAVGKVPVAVVENVQKDKNISKIENNIKKEDISNFKPSLKSSKYTTDSHEIKNIVFSEKEKEGDSQLVDSNTDNVIETNVNTYSISSIVENNVKIEEVNNNKSYFNEVKDDRVSRALLTTGLNNREPIDNITSPVYVSKQDAIKLHYFTEIMNMEGGILYHHWMRNGELVFKREIKILGVRWRASTNKFIQHFNQGEWAVMLVNEEGDVLNKIQFMVVEK